MSLRSFLISVLIVGCGWLGASWLSRVDHDLRIIYSENTLAATDLGHIYADLIRYRSTILRAIEADSERDFTRICSSLPVIRSRMEGAVDRYIRASNRTTAVKKIDARELAELKAVQARLETYLQSSDQTIDFMKQMWETSNPGERGRFRQEAERYAATVAGPKLLEVTIALEELMATVGKLAGDLRDEGDRQLRVLTVATMAVSLTLAGLVLLPQK